MANSSIDRVRKLIDNRMADLSTDPTKKIAMDVLKELRESINQINDYDERTKRFEFQSFIYVILELVRLSLKPNLKTVFTVDLLNNNSKVADDPMLLLSDDDFSTIRESISALDRTNNLHVFAVLSFHKLAKLWLQDQDPTDDHRKSTTTTYLKDIISEIDTKMLEIKTNADQDESDEESKSDEEQDVDYDERIKQIEHETFIDDMLELFRHSLNPNLKTKFKNYLIYNSNVCEDPITLLSDKDFSSIRESISALDRTNNLHRIAVLSFRKLAKLWLHDRVQDPTDYNIKNLQDLISDIDTKLLEIRSRQTEQKEPTQSKSNVEQEQIKSNADQDDSDEESDEEIKSNADQDDSDEESDEEESDEEESDEEMLVFHSRQTEQKEPTQSKSNVEQEQIKSNADQDDSNEESDEEMLEIHSRQTEQKEPTQSKSNVEQEQVKSNAYQDDSNEESDEENLQSGIKMNGKAKEVEMSCKRRADDRIAEKPDSMNLNQATQSEPDSPPFFDIKGSDNGCSDQNCEKPLSLGRYESSSLKRSSTTGKGNLKETMPHFLSESSASENTDLMRDLKRQKNLTNGDGIVQHSTSYHNKLVDSRCDLEIKSDKVTGALVPSHAPSDLYPSTGICSFCQSSKISEATGSMLHYASGISVAGEAAMQPNVVHVHKVCID